MCVICRLRLNLNTASRWHHFCRPCRGLHKVASSNPASDKLSSLLHCNLLLTVTRQGKTCFAPCNLREYFYFRLHESFYLHHINLMNYSRNCHLIYQIWNFHRFSVLFKQQFHDHSSLSKGYIPLLVEGVHRTCTKHNQYDGDLKEQKSWLGWCSMV